MVIEAGVVADRGGVSVVFIYSGPEAPFRFTHIGGSAVVASDFVYNPSLLQFAQLVVRVAILAATLKFLKIIYKFELGISMLTVVGPRG